MSEVAALLDAVAKRRRDGPPLSDADEALIELLIDTGAAHGWIFEDD